MPIFEYVCRKCSHRFEVIVLGRTAPSCPSCGGADLEKAFSVFAVGTQSGGAKPSRQARGCGTCGDPRGPGSCSTS